MNTILKNQPTASQDQTTTKPPKKWRKIGKFILISLALVTLLLCIGWITTMPTSATRGIWQTKGHGMIIDANTFLIDVYDVTEMSCTHAMQFPANNWILNTLERVSIDTVDGLLRINSPTIEPIYAEKIDALPETCNATPNDPITNFDIFWHTFNEHYAFFELHGVDWNARYTEFRPQVHSDTSSVELFEIISAALEGLDDGHVGVMLDDTHRYSPRSRPEWFTNRAQFDNHYMPYIQGEVYTIPQAHIHYGWLSDEIAYIRLGQMYPDIGLGQDPLNVAREAMAEIAAQIGKAETIVMDVRFNPGGFDLYSLAIAEHFVSEPTYVLSKSTRTDNGYTEVFDAYLEPTQEALFTQPVYLLTSQLTGSAAEIFTLAMRALPQVTVVGTPTDGGLSDAMERTLPNGMFLRLSNQRYIAADGNLYEGVGIPPDIEFPFDAEGFASGRDTTLEKAVEIVIGR